MAGYFKATERKYNALTIDKWMACERTGFSPAVGYNGLKKNEDSAKLRTSFFFKVGSKERKKDLCHALQMEIHLCTITNNKNFNNKTFKLN